MSLSKTLVFFTLQYPYGKKSETFIENEIPYLAETFKRVIIIPREKNDTERRELPNNVEVNDLLIHNKTPVNHFVYILGSYKRLFASMGIYLFTIFKDKKRSSYLKSGYFIYYLANALNDAKQIEGFIKKENLQQAVYYDYWFVNSTLSLAYLKSKRKINTLYCRAHGFDVFNERWDCGSVPFRAYIFKHITKVFAISAYNKRYIVSQLKYHIEKLEVAYLGVRKPKSEQLAENDQREEKTFVIVSCANLFPFKQIKRIPEVLKNVALAAKPIKWVHFGDGPDEAEVLQAAHVLPPLIDFEYKGHVSNHEVLNFYALNKVDLFLSLSLKEGLPVSMMEAQSFGVPIIAYNIFGIPEIVNDETGILLDLDATDEEIAEKVSQVLRNDVHFETRQIKEFFEQNFSAKRNFRAFTKNLIKDD